jgi:hypothetical protein
MPTIIVIVISFITALFGVLHDYAAKSDRRSYGGLTRRGLMLVALASLGMIFGIASAIGGIRSGNEITNKLDEDTILLREIYPIVVGSKSELASSNPARAEQLGRIAERISAAASLGRKSNFSMSDFSESDFSRGNFTRASFRDALFREADLRGADLSTAKIDESTRLPTK